MTKNEPKIIPFDSDEAAKPTTLSGWISRDGFFYYRDRAEASARYSGCTHRPCEECGTLTEKMWICCADCRAKHDAERWAKKPREEWDGKEPLYLEAIDRYAFDEDTILDEMLDHGKSFDDLKPTICERVGVAMLDTEHWSDDIPEDGDAPDELVEAIEAFNKAVENVTMCWRPTDVVATWKDAPTLEQLKEEANKP